MTTLHICHLISGLNEHGGMERHVKDLTSELVKNLRVSVLADPSMQPLFTDTVAFVPIDFRRGRLNPKLSFELFQHLKALAPDCVHVHGRKAAVLFRRLNTVLRQPSVLTLHNLSPASKLCRKFDAVIGVSTQITDQTSHPYKFTIHNGRSTVS